MILFFLPVHRGQRPDARSFGYDDVVALADFIDQSPVRDRKTIAKVREIGDLTSALGTNSAAPTRRAGLSAKSLM